MVSEFGPGTDESGDGPVEESEQPATSTIATDQSKARRSTVRVNDEASMINKPIETNV
jgi:hypothetical protein